MACLVCVGLLKAGSLGLLLSFQSTSSTRKTNVKLPLCKIAKIDWLVPCVDLHFYFRLKDLSVQPYEHQPLMFQSLIIHTQANLSKYLAISLILRFLILIREFV